MCGHRLSEMSRYPAAWEITSIRADFLVELRGFEYSDLKEHRGHARWRAPPSRYAPPAYRRELSRSDLGRRCFP